MTVALSVWLHPESLLHFYTMVSFKHLAVAGLLASANGLSLVPAIQDFFNLPLLAQIDSETNDDVVKTFPPVDERPIPGNSPIIQCDVSEPQLLDLQSVVIDPNPPQKGANLTFVASGFLSQDIEDGAYVEVDVRYGFIRLIHQTFDLCEEITNVDLECPVKKGEQTIQKQVEIPEEVPPGKYLVNARAYTSDNVLITCLSALVEFPPN